MLSLPLSSLATVHKYIYKMELKFIERIIPVEYAENEQLTVSKS